MEKQGPGAAASVTAHDRLFHPGNQDRAAPRVGPRDGQGGVRRTARHAAADRLRLLRRIRGRGPARRAGAGRRTAGHDLTSGLLGGAGHRGEARRGDRRGCHREGARAQRRRRPRGGHRHRSRRQRPRSASGPVSADPRSRAAAALHAADVHDVIRVHGARVNNLEDVSVEIPKRRLTVFTGVSGSGKSSLVFGTIAAESQRLINETYSAFVQGFMPALARPDVDVLEGLTTAIIVDQERLGANPRSTVGTVTDANAMLRLLWSRIGKPHIGPPPAFSFNIPTRKASGAMTVDKGKGERITVRGVVYHGGMCPRCEGRGAVTDFDLT